jgi:uncharacterized delta-60 repeat protein
MVTTDFRRDSDGFHGGASALVVQPDGKLVAGGTVAGLGNDSGRASDFALVRYGPDGSLDAKFGVGGKVTTSFSTGDHVHDEFEALVSLPDGRLVGAGATEAEFGYRFALTAYNPDGSLDPLFGTGGKVVTDFASDPLLGTHNSIARALVVQADGKLVAAGFATRPLSFSPDVSLARYEGPNDSACVHDRIPPRIAKMFRRAIAFIDESVAEPSIRQKKLHRKAKSLLNAVKRAAHGATKGNRPKLSGACAAEIRSAAGTVSQSL